MKSAISQIVAQLIVHYESGDDNWPQVQSDINDLLFNQDKSFDNITFWKNVDKEIKELES